MAAKARRGLKPRASNSVMQKVKQGHAAASRSNNPFEQIRTRKKFNILGKKQKGTEKRITQKRSAAVEKRRDTLLVEYKQLRKSNAFVDRRFGEGDESLTQEEKALMRFQKQRMKELAGSKFTLADEDDFDGSEFQLTHEGKSLADALDKDDGWRASDDDADDGTDILEKYNFGGGSGEMEGSAGKDGEGNKFKSKKEIMEEVIAKSKMFKAMKSKQREEDMEETDALDLAWRQLSQTNAAATLLRPKGSRYETNAASKALMSQEDKTYDTLARELVFEAKAQAGERTLTKEELADLEQQRLEELEKGRMAREAGGDDLDDDFQGVAGARNLDGQRVGGYAARRARLKAKQREEEESDAEDSEGSDEEEEDAVSALEARRQAQAAGDHPLQAQFRDIAASLLERHQGGARAAKLKGILKKAAEDDEEGSDGEESDDDDEGDSQSGEEEEGNSSSAEDDEVEEEDQGEAGDAKALDTSGKSNTNDDRNTSSKEIDAEAKHGRDQPDIRGDHRNVHVDALGGPNNEQETEKKLNMTFTPRLPESFDEYKGLMQGIEPDQVGEMLNRIRAYNASALSEDGRKKLQILYGCIMQHFMSLASQEEVSLSALDPLVPHLVELTPYVPFYSGALSRARLEREHEVMKADLKDAVRKSDAWPRTKVILLAKLLMDVYPVTDKRHPVLTPLNTFLCGALTLCPIVKPIHAVKGIVISHLLLNAHKRSARLVPEVLNFATYLLRAFTAFTSMEFEDDQGEYKWMCALKRSPFADADRMSNKKGSRKQQGRKTGDRSPTEGGYTPSLSLEACFSQLEDSFFRTSAFCDSLFHAAIELVRSASQSVDVDAFEELFDPAVPLLEALDAHMTSEDSFFSQKSAQNVQEVLRGIREKAERISGARAPVTISAMNAAPQVKQYTPKFEESFVKGKDYDPDRQRAEERRLKKLLRKEERGAIRELRKDATFMANVRDQEKNKLHTRLENSAKRAMSFLEQQQADFKSGGQQGMWKKSKKR